MAITVTCPSCSSSFPVDPAKVPEGGVNARCSSCGDIFRIEKPVEAEPLPTLENITPVEAPPEPVETSAPPAAVETPEPPAAEPPPIPEEPVAEAMEHAPEPAADPFAQPAPFEEAPAGEAPALPEPEVAAELPPVEMAETLPAPDIPDVTPAEPEAPEPEAAEAVAETSAPAVQGFTFGKRDPTDKAKRLARVLVSDMIMYNAERHQTALAQGTLQQDFEEEIDKSWKEFVEQVGEELANNEGRAFWKDALNDILAKGEQVF